MSDQNPIESKNAGADDLAKKPGNVQMNEEELKQVSGGTTEACCNGKHISE
jgi:bacteriocin-like protein